MSKTIEAVCKTYRRIPIYETAEGFYILTSDNKRIPFNNWKEATAFVDAWYAAQYLVSTT